MKQKSCRLKFTTALGLYDRSFAGWQSSSFFEWYRNISVYNEFLNSIKKELSAQKCKPCAVIYGGGLCGETMLQVIEDNSLAEVVAVVDRNTELENNFPKHNFFADINEVETNRFIDFIVVATGPVHYNDIVKRINSSNKNCMTKESTILFMFDDIIDQAGSSSKTKDIPSKIVISTLQKSGSVWLTTMMKSLLNENYKYNSETDHTALDFHRVLALKNNEYTYGHFFAKNLSQFFDYPDYKFIFLYRDLRDQIISYHFYHKYGKHQLANLRNIQEYLSDFDDNASIAMHIKGFSSDDRYVPSAKVSTENIKKWKQVHQQYENIHLITYEELKKDTVVTMNGIMSFLNQNVSEQRLNEVVEQSSFKNMAKGRTIGDEDKTSHQRKGIIGDWKNHFTDRHKNIFKSEVGDFLIEAGYEEDNNW